MGLGLLGRDVLGQLQQHRARPLLGGDPEGVAHDGGDRGGRDDLPAILVIGFMELITSTIWNLACRDDRMPFWPVMMIIGIAPRWA